MAIHSQSLVQYRIYADGTVIGEDLFKEYDTQMDESEPYYDNYHVVFIPQLIIEHIESEALGK